MKSQENSKQQIPFNIEAEQSTIGTLLNNNAHLEKIIEFLKPEHFFIPLHARIFELIIKFADKGSVATPVTLKGHIDQSMAEGLDGIGIFEYLAKLSAIAQVVYDIELIAKHVYDLSMRRQLILIAEETIIESRKDDIDLSTSKRIESVEQKLFNLGNDGFSEKNAEQLDIYLKSAIQKITKAKERGGVISGVSTKLIEIDKMTAGLQPSDLIIIAARPSMGKTALAVNIAINAVDFFKEEYKKSNNTKPLQSVGFISLEMSSDQVAARVLSMRANVDGSKIRTGSVTKEEFERLSIQSAELSSAKLFIDDTPALSISSIRTRARRLKRQHNLGLLIVDYLQLVRPSIISRDSNRVNEIGEISQGLKALAKELDIPVIALSQLSRAVETREDKRPLLSDLRESGNIEQDADIVMFIYREEYYLERKVPIEFDKNADWQERLNKVQNIAEIIIAKQRNGPVGSCTLRFDSKTTNFSNIDLIF